MPALISHQLSFQLETGEWLFKDINFSLPAGVTGLIGRNGSGKSVFLSLLTGGLTPTLGSVSKVGPVAHYSQLPSELLKSQMTIAQFLEIDQKRAALESITQGSCEPSLFEIVGDDWNLENQTLDILDSLRLPADLDIKCCQLSGGQIALLQLYKLFKSDAQMLLFDEPSNHMDSVGKTWLIEKLRQETRPILLVSHDRRLLREVDNIYQLSSLGMANFSGNYDEFVKHQSQQSLALDKRINQLTSEKKKIEKQAQINREKAQQRESQGNRKRHSGSQPKILIDAMKGKAEQSRSAAITNQQNQLIRNQNKLSELKKQQEVLKPQAVYLNNAQQVKKRTLVSLDNVRLDFGYLESITLTIKHMERWHIEGDNGSGKSTLLKAIQGQQPCFRGHLKRMTQTVYLDQYFGLLEPSLSLLDNLMKYCITLSESEARILLAGIGLRRDTVHRKAGDLSGGEKMKLAMLVVSHIEGEPLLLLDEPDNHLDIESKQILAGALLKYKGSFVVVSHDKDFVSELGINRTLVLKVS